MSGRRSLKITCLRDTSACWGLALTCVLRLRTSVNSLASILPSGERQTDEKPAIAMVKAFGASYDRTGPG